MENSENIIKWAAVPVTLSLILMVVGIVIATRPHKRVLGDYLFHIGRWAITITLFVGIIILLIAFAIASISGKI